MAWLPCLGIEVQVVQFALCLKLFGLTRHSTKPLLVQERFYLIKHSSKAREDKDLPVWAFLPDALKSVDEHPDLGRQANDPLCTIF